MRLLFTVTYRGEYYRYFGSRFGGPDGIVLGPWLASDDPVRAGDPLLLRRPDGSLIRTRVDALAMAGPGMCPSIRLSRLIFLHDVPRGTEVWALEDRE